MKTPMTPAEIEPATFRFVAQLLKHCVNAVPAADVPFLGIQRTCITKAYGVLVGKHDGKTHLEDLVTEDRIMLKWIFKT